MQEHYQILEIQPVDMFPHTYHIECVTKLEKKKDDEKVVDKVSFAGIFSRLFKLVCPFETLWPCFTGDTVGYPG